MEGQVMSAYSGKQFRGAARARRLEKRAEAEARNARTPAEDRSKKRPPEPDPQPVSGQRRKSSRNRRGKARKES